MNVPTHAMVLAAGRGRRLGALGEKTPKPLVRVAGKALLDYVLDELAAGGVSDAVVNVHHLADQVRAHLAARTGAPQIAISDETDLLRDTGGGVVKALPLIGQKVFVVAGSDVIRRGRGLAQLAAVWDETRMDVAMLMQPRETSVGFDGAGDFLLDGEGRATRRGAAPSAPFVYAQLLICHARLYDGAPDEPFSNNLVWDKAIATDRFRGVVHDGDWYHVGSPAGIAAAERALGR